MDSSDSIIDEFTFERFPSKDSLCVIDNIVLDEIFLKNKAHFLAFNYDRNDLDENYKLFASRYIAFDMSQGSETLRTYIFDCTNGNMYESPLYMYKAEYRKNSRLYIKDPDLNPEQKEECQASIFDCTIAYFLWNEEKQIFEKVK